MTGLSQILSFRNFFTLGNYEKDRDFRALIEDISLRGMYIAGFLGTIAVLVYVGAHILLIQKTVVWTYAGIDPKNEIVLLDKAIILILSLISVAFSRRPLPMINSRFLIGGMVWIISLSMLLDDIVANNQLVAPEYISFAIILAVGAMPYTGWQTATLTSSVIITTLLVVYLVPVLYSLPPVDLRASQIIYLILLAVVLTGMSSQLYLNRFEQYQARRQAEKLNKQLEDRALMLEKMKEKSELQAQHIMEHEQLKDRFFANISHDFRTPLTLILGPLKDLLTRADEHDKISVETAILQMMQDNGKRLLLLINQLLDLSRIDAGELHLDLQQIEWAPLVRNIVLSFTPMAERKNINLSWTVADPSITVWADPQHLERAISNLVNNAIKFTPEGGKVEVQLSDKRAADGFIILQIKDNGCGITEEDQAHIFDRFYQAEQPADVFNEGTGIGLALAREIIELHGGSISVSSEVGQGSEFTITLNRAEGGAGLSKEVKHSKWESLDIDESTPIEQFEQAGDDAPIIMVVDDNPDILTYLTSYLSGRYRVIAKQRGMDALKEIKNGNVNLVISDVKMPPPDGFELCRIIKETPDLDHIPVILLTAQTSEESRIEGLELGADDYIGKPFSVSELLIRVENLIEVRRSLREKFSREVRLEGREVEVSSEEARFLERLQAVIEDHIEDNNFGVDWLADEMNLSTRQLQRKVQVVTRMSAGGYIRLMRLERAGQLLQQHWGNVSEVAWKVGFRDVKYFSRLFKQTFGTSPSEFAEVKQGSR